MKQKFYLITLFLAFALCVNAEGSANMAPSTNENGQYKGPFKKKLYNLIVRKDEEGDNLYYASGNNPAYYYDGNYEYFFAGEMFDDNSLLSGELLRFNRYGWSESFGSFNDEGYLVVGVRFEHNYFSSSNPTMYYYSKKNGIRIFELKDEATMYKLIRHFKDFEFDDEDYPKSVKALPMDTKPKVFTKNYCMQEMQKTRSQMNIVSKPQNSSGLTASGKLFTFGMIAAAFGLAANAFSDDSGGSSSSSSSSNSSATPRDKYEYGNVEIVSWGTLGSLAISHAKVELRNKNNYDVNVSIGLYQGSWSLGEIIYSNYERSDYISGVSDEYSNSIRVKANSMRTVYLKADHRGRPTHIRIESVR